MPVWGGGPGSNSRLAQLLPPRTSQEAFACWEKGERAGGKHTGFPEKLLLLPLKLLARLSRGLWELLCLCFRSFSLSHQR